MRKTLFIAALLAAVAAVSASSSDASAGLRSGERRQLNAPIVGEKRPRGASQGIQEAADTNEHTIAEHSRQLRYGRRKKAKSTTLSATNAKKDGKSTRSSGRIRGRSGGGRRSGRKSDKNRGRSDSRDKPSRKKDDSSSRKKYGSDKSSRDEKSDGGNKRAKGEGDESRSGRPSRNDWAVHDKKDKDHSNNNNRTGMKNSKGSLRSGSRDVDDKDYSRDRSTSKDKSNSRGKKNDKKQSDDKFHPRFDDSFRDSSGDIDLFAGVLTHGRQR